MRTFPYTLPCVSLPLKKQTGAFLAGLPLTQTIYAMHGNFSAARLHTVKTMPDILHGSDQAMPAISRIIAYIAHFGHTCPRCALIGYQNIPFLSTLFYIFRENFLFAADARQARGVSAFCTRYYKPARASLTTKPFYRTMLYSVFIAIPVYII